MSYWGTSYFPSRFLGSKVQIRKVLSTTRFSDIVGSRKDQEREIYSPTIIETSSQISSQNQPVAIYSPSRTQTILRQIFGRKVLSSTRTETGVSGTKQQVVSIVSDTDKIIGFLTSRKDTRSIIFTEIASDGSVNKLFEWEDYQGIVDDEEDFVTISSD